ncbi:MAG: hypothetical protein ACREFE_07180 [Limisphaerales bacterium]
MTKKNLVLIAFALALAVVYIYFFTDWFKSKTIQIVHTERPMIRRFRRGAPISVITFGFDRAYRLNEIKVVPLVAWRTNSAVLPVWHLISDAGSEPLKFFRYGQPVRGMKPSVAGSRAQPLEPNVIYRLLVRAGSIKGRHDFQLGGLPPTATNQTSSR